MVRVIQDTTYTFSQYHQNTNANNFRSISDNNNPPINNDLYVYNRYLCRYGISPHTTTQYEQLVSNIYTNIVNSNQNSLSTLSVNYIGYFYHVFPLHPNTFNVLFGDVINPKLLYLKSCIDGFIYSFTEIYNLKKQFQYIINFYYKNKSHLESTLSFKLFIDRIDHGKLFEPYVKILIGAIDHDIDVLTILYSFINSFYYNLRFFLHDSHKFVKKHEHIIKLLQSHKSHPDLKFLENFINIFTRIDEILILIKSLCGSIPAQESISRSFRIKILLESFKNRIDKNINPQIDSSKLKFDLETYIKSNKIFSLRNIQDLEIFKNLFNHLLLLIQKLKFFISDLNLLKKELRTQRGNLVFYTSQILYKGSVSYPFDSTYLSGPFSDSNFFPNKKYLYRLDKIASESTVLLDSIMIELKFIIEIIPNLRQKLFRARSILDKQEFIISIIDFLEFKNIESLNKIHQIIDKIDNEKLKDEYISQTFSNRFNITLTYIIYNLINDKNPTDFIKYLIKQSLSIINNLISINKSNDQLKRINNELNTVNINVKIETLRLTIKEIKGVVSEIELNIISKIESKILQMEEIKLYINNYRYLYKQENRIKIDEILDNIILVLKGILNLIKDMVQKLECFKKKLQNKLECCENHIKDLECAIDGVARNFIKCSTKQLSINIGGLDINKTVVSIYSVSNVMDYKVLVNRLFECAKKIDQITRLIPWPDECQCVLRFESFNTRIDLGQFSFFKIIDNLTSMSRDNFVEFLRLYEIKKLQEPEMGINHSCLCMVIKYKLYPQILNLINIISFELESLSTISRKYDRYRISTIVSSGVIKMSIVSVELLDKICIFMERRYLWATSKITMIPGLICFCRAPEDKYYHLILNTVLVISYMTQNIVSMDNHDMRIAIECLSNFSYEFDIITKDNNIGWNICKLFIYQIIINKYCSSNSDPPCDPKCCCVTCILIILMSVYICISYNINSKLCPKKCPQIKERICCLVELFCKYLGSQCCIKEILESISTGTNCKNLQNGCEQWLSKCNELCNGVTKQCQPDCICNKVKQCLPKLCESFKGEIEKVLECIDKCCKSDVCKCCRCKIVSYAIKVMWKNMVLIEYNMKQDIKFNSLTFGSITRIVLSNNIKSLYLCRNELGISLVKNSSISHGTGLDNLVTYVTSVRNWGYDTHFEHQSTSKINDGYPNLHTSSYTGRDSRNKMFKLVLSRLLICAFIVLMFLYLRISYQQFLLSETLDSYDSNLDINQNEIDNVNHNTNVDVVNRSSSYLVDMFLNSNNYTTNYTSTETVPNEV